MKIVFLDAATLGDLSTIDVFKRFGEYVTYDYTADNQRLERMRGADIVITNKVKIDRALMDACPELKLICVAATGVNIIDCAYAAEKGIPVKNVAGYSTQSVTQMTFSILFELMSHTSYFNEYVKTRYAGSPSFTNVEREYYELAGKRWGIIGLGTIGSNVARVAQAFGAEPVYYSTSGKNNNAQFSRVELDELMRTSDVISVHAPLNAATDNLLTYSKLSLMKSSAVILNMGRGGIVNESDLARILDEGKIAGAGLDVFTREPLPAGHPLLTMQHPERLVATPHVAWASVEARYRIVDLMEKNIATWVETGK